MNNLTAPIRGSGSTTGIWLIFRGISFSHNSDIGQIGHLRMGTTSFLALSGFTGVIPRFSGGQGDSLLRFFQEMFYYWDNSLLLRI